MRIGTPLQMEVLMRKNTSINGDFQQSMFHDRRVFSKIPIFTNIVCHHCKSPLLGGLEHDFFDFPYIRNVIIPTDFHSIIFQRGRSTPNQYIYIYIKIVIFYIWLVISPIIYIGYFRMMVFSNSRDLSIDILYDWWFLPLLFYGDICHHCKSPIPTIRRWPIPIRPR